MKNLIIIWTPPVETIEDLTIKYDSFTTHITSGVEDQLPKYCLELNGPEAKTIIYARDEERFEYLKTLLVTNSQPRIFIREHVVVVYIHYYPTGWPCQTIGRREDRYAGDNFRPGGPSCCPDYPPGHYSCSRRGGIAVIGPPPDFSARSMSYRDFLSATTEGNLLIATFKDNHDENGFVRLVVLTANESLATKLRAAVERKRVHRIMLNAQVLNIKITMGDRSSLEL
jgi:hypothetical protein